MKKKNMFYTLKILREAAIFWNLKEILQLRLDTYFFFTTRDSESVRYRNRLRYPIRSIGFRKTRVNGEVIHHLWCYVYLRQYRIESAENRLPAPSFFSPSAACHGDIILK